MHINIHIGGEHDAFEPALEPLEEEGGAVVADAARHGASVDLEAGDAVVLSGEHSAFSLPPDGLGAVLVYRFASCHAADDAALYRSPFADARVRLQRAHLQRCGVAT